MKNRKIKVVYDNGVVIGHYGWAYNNEGKQVRVFIPDRDQDIADRRRALVAQWERSEQKFYKNWK